MSHLNSSYINKITWKKTVHEQEHAYVSFKFLSGSHFLEGDFLDLIVIQVYSLLIYIQVPIIFK